MAPKIMRPLIFTYILTDVFLKLNTLYCNFSGLRNEKVEVEILEEISPVSLKLLKELTSCD